VKRAQLDMQLVVTRVTAATAVESEASTRTTLESAKQSAEDRAMVVQPATATATTERDALATRLVQTEAEIERLWTAAATTNDTTEKATNAVAAAKVAAWDAA
jgi:hypothetical protein